MFAGENILPARDSRNDAADLVRGGCRTRSALGLSTVHEMAIVLYHIPSRAGVFYPAVIICLLSAILSRVGGSIVSARGDGILP